MKLLNSGVTGLNSGNSNFPFFPFIFYYSEKNLFFLYYPKFLASGYYPNWKGGKGKFLNFQTYLLLKLNFDKKRIKGERKE
ncbi:MAG: hypothetical protein C6I01_01595 [Epsilonproteobacteria bacterium]|nr:hypothetical protein [Campylobacterota bacterium]